MPQNPLSETIVVNCVLRKTSLKVAPKLMPIPFIPIINLNICIDGLVQERCNSSAYLLHWTIDILSMKEFRYRPRKYAAHLSQFIKCSMGGKLIRNRLIIQSWLLYSLYCNVQPRPAYYAPKPMILWQPFPHGGCMNDSVRSHTSK